MSRDGTGRVYKRGNVWWIQYGFRGKDLRESSKSTRKGDANKLLKKRLAEMGSGTFVGRDAERVTFADLAQMIVDDYAVNGRKSAQNVRSALKHLRPYFGASRAVDITTDRATAYIRQRQEDGAANATIMNEIACLKRMFTLAVQAGRLPTKPYIPRVEVNNTREGFFTPDELARIVDEIRDPLKPVVRFLALTGWRKSEALGLKWAQVDFDAGEVRLTAARSKNKQGRVFPFHVLPPLAELLEAQRERTRAVEKRTGRIIPHVFHRDGAAIKDMRGAWDAACERAKVPGAWIHDLRRTAVRNMERAGVSRSVAMKLSGHKTEAVYRRYAIADSVALEEGVAKLAALHSAPAATRKVVPIDSAKSA